MSERTLSVTGFDTSSIKVNPGESGFYRVDYPAQMLAALQGPIKRKILAPIDRLGVIRDAFAASESGDLPTTQALEAVKAYVDETDYTVWVEISHGFSNVRNIVHDQKCGKDFEEFCLQIFKKIAKKVGFAPKKNEGHTTSLLRSLVLHNLVSFGDPATIKKAKALFNSGRPVPANIRSVVYEAVARDGSAKLHAQFIERYKNEMLSEEKGRIGRALGQFEDKALLKKTLDFAMSNDVRIQDTPGIFAGVWHNFKGADLAWEYTKKNWQKLLDTYPASGHIINRFIKPASYFNSVDYAHDVESFFKKHKAPGAERAIAQVLEKIYSHDAWLKRDGESISKWLKKTGE